MSRFEVGDIVYPVFYPKEDTKCIVVEVDKPCPCGCGLKVLIVKTEDNRLINEIEECFVKEEEFIKSIF